MATYCVITSAHDDWGDASNRFKTRRQADTRFEEMRQTHQLVRLIRWENNVAIEMRRERSAEQATQVSE